MTELQYETGAAISHKLKGSYKKDKNWSSWQQGIFFPSDFTVEQNVNNAMLCIW